ncbi:MAG TPA: pyruvate formate lyase family protein [Bacillota bacterium]|jgi:pyruvate formate-lyase/glycerol dehydratase family glycyl radical enzyme|nr:pyruvate formate lyase family protein [Bacillota bacterium]
MAVQVWKAGTLSPRVQRLRDEYWSFYEREYYRNECLAYSTGDPWDELYAPYNWGVVPEVFLFAQITRHTVKAMAEKVEVPPDFYRLSIAERRALFFNLVLEKHLPAQVLEGELIVGSHFNTALSKNLDKKEAARWARDTYRWFKQMTEAHDLGLGNTGAIPGHLIPNYRKVLQIGFRGIAEQVSERMAGENSPEKLAYLNALKISTGAPLIISRRFAEVISGILEKEKDPGRREELSRMREIVSRVPYEKPRSFWEALQALWFTHMLIMAAESYPGAGLSYGRIDQYLYPFYKADLERGVLTREFAKELLHCFWIKHNYVYDYQGRAARNQGINSGFGQLITLSGCGPRGEDLTNDLTMLMLEVIEEINLIEPKPNIRLHGNSSPELLKKMASMIKKAQGAPFLINFDRISMKALEFQGVPREDVWDYAPVGCLENTMQGNDRSGTVDCNVNLAKAVELALNDGKDMQTGRQVGPRTGDPRRFYKKEDFLKAFYRQLDFVLDRLMDLAAEADRIRSVYDPTPYLSLLVDGCIEKALDVNRGGAVYKFITVEGVGMATMADSVTAVCKLVYDDRAVSMEQLLEALREDFKGHEVLQQMLINRAPKYGNNDDYADGIAREINSYWSRKVFQRTSPATGRRFRAGYLSWNYWISYAPLTASSPDGRARGQALSNGVCCVNGVDRRGPTAAVASVGKLGLETVPNGASHTMSFNPSFLRDEEHIEKFISFLKTYHEIGGSALQVNMIDPGLLRKALENPAAYTNLLVRVTGYNAYFVHLGPEIQQEIIRRESHAI